MAVVKQNTVSSSKSGSTTALQWNHTVESGSNLCLIVAVTIDASAQYPSTVTYNNVAMTRNFYIAGDDATLKYRHGETQVACEAASWNSYTGSFVSLGYVQIRLEG